MSTKAQAAGRFAVPRSARKPLASRGKRRNPPAAEAKVRKAESPLGWTLWHASNVGAWSVSALEWIMEGAIQQDALGFLSGPPKVGKSFLALDLCDAIIRGGKWLDRYQCRPVNVLYIAREDPPRRLRDRLLEIQQTKTTRPTGRLLFLIRERMSLLNSEHREEIKRIISEHSIQLVVLDVVNRMIPNLDENDAASVGNLVDSMEDVRESFGAGVSVLAIDHTRKGSGQQQVSPFELKGSIAKYGACDFILCVGRKGSDLELYFENKDVDHATRLLLAISPKGAAGPKFKVRQELEATPQGKAQQGAGNRAAVLKAIESKWLGKQEIVRLTSLGASTVVDHLNALVRSGEIEKTGRNKNTRYRRKQPTGKRGGVRLVG